jgi:hypothetical protein
MADYAISNVPRRVVYAASGVGPYAFTFEILVNTDVAVYRDDTLLTLTTDYSVAIAANGTGTVTLVASPTGATQIAIVGSRAIQRTSDFVTGGDFFANTVNDEMDSLTIFAQQNAEGLARALQAPQTDPLSIDMTLPRKVFRVGKLLAFNSTTGDPEAGPDISNFSGIYQGAFPSAPSTRFDTTPLQAGDLYFDSTSDSMRVYTGGAWQEIAPEMAIGHQAYTATAGQTTFPVTDGYNVDSVYVYLNGVLLDAADYTATNGTSIVLTNAAALDDTIRVVTYFNPVDTISIRNAAIASAAAAAASESAAATSATNSSNSASSAATSATNASNSANAAAASFDAFDDRYLGSKSSNPSVDNDGNTLLDGALYFDTTDNVLKVYDLGNTAWVRTTPTDGEQAHINTVSGIAGSVLTVAGISGNVTTVAGISANVTTVAGISANVTSVAGNATNINTVAGSIANVNAVGNNISNVNSVAGNATNINAVVSNATNINTVAGISANVTTVATNNAKVTTVADNIADIIINADNIAAIEDAVPNAALALASANAAALSETAAAASAASALGSQVAAAGSAASALASEVSAAASAASADQSEFNAAASAFAAAAAPYDINTDTDFGLITDAGGAFFADETGNLLLTMTKGAGAFTYGSI